jgi:large subunit ribosomal protein L4
MEAKVYNNQGKEVSSIKLPEDVFGAPWNDSLVHQVAISMTANERTPIAHTKNRGEVSGTGKKPWKQKGTGRARHGSRRSPIWVGGGVSHGPRKDRDYSKKINKKMKVGALFSVLSKKMKDGELVLVDNISFASPKTRDAKSMMSSLSKVKDFAGLGKRKNAAFIALPTKDENVSKSFRNFGNLEVGDLKDLNVVDLLSHKYLILTNPEDSIKMLSSRKK